MKTIAALLRRAILGLSADEASFERRGFPFGSRVVRERLECVGHTFVRGYNAAIELGREQGLGARMQHEPEELRGFAFEGAAMGLALLDIVTPWRSDRLATFMRRDASRHIYMAHVGAGWALARLNRRVGPVLTQFDPLLRWLLIDGYGFHQGYFDPDRWVVRLTTPSLGVEYAARAFDQGLGRSIWFVTCGDAARVQTAIERFAPHRRADLWSGVGLACAYAGGATPMTLQAIARAAHWFRPQLAQGTAFAAKTRERAGNEAAHTEMACQILCGVSARGAARITDEALVGLSGDTAVPLYEVWRRRIAERFSNTTHMAHAITARMAR
jgi:enediyne biosynthesis protein E3